MIPNLPFPEGERFATPKIPKENAISRKRAPLSSAEVLVYQFCLFHFNSLSFDSISVRVGENEALVPYY